MSPAMPSVLNIGTLADGTPVTLDPESKRYLSEGVRIGLFASSGAGKGYLLGVLIEELIAAGYPVVMVDAESELWTFRERGALVLGGPHGHAPFNPDAGAAIEAALSYALDTLTPLVFDLHGRSPNEVRTAFEAIATPYWSLIEHTRRPAVLAITEAHLVAPQVLPRGASYDTELLPRIQSGGRKRGAITIVETQRMAEIANAVIGHCNVRFVGRIDLEDDFKRLRQGLPRDIDFATVSTLESGRFIAPRLTQGLPSDVIHVRERTVTHGGETPTGGPVRLRKDTTGKALAGMAERLAFLMAASTKDTEAPPNASPSSPEARRRSGRRDAPLEQRSDAPAAGPATNPLLMRLADVERERDDAIRQVQRMREYAAEREREHAEEHEALEALHDKAELRSAQLEEQLHGWHTVLDVLATALAGRVAPALGEYSPAALAAGGLTEAQVVEIVRQHAGTGARPALRPVEALRTEYLERSAQRLVALVRELDADEREALLFHLAHPALQTLNAVAKGLSGSDSGSVRQRWSKAVQSLEAKGLLAKSGNGLRRASVDAWVRSALGPHNPTDQEIADVVDRALSVVMTEDA